MNRKEYITVLKDSLSRESEMMELLEECFKEIFPNQPLALHLLQQNYDNYDDFGCMQSLIYFRNRLEVKS